MFYNFFVSKNNPLPKIKSTLSTKQSKFKSETHANVCVAYLSSFTNVCRQHTRTDRQNETNGHTFFFHLFQICNCWKRRSAYVFGHDSISLVGSCAVGCCAPAHRYQSGAVHSCSVTRPSACIGRCATNSKTSVNSHCVISGRI